MADFSKVHLGRAPCGGTAGFLDKKNMKEKKHEILIATLDAM
jgi:hypothetical protein